MPKSCWPATLVLLITFREKALYFERICAVADFFGLHARLQQNRQQEIRHRRIQLIGQMPSGLELPAELTGHQARRLECRCRLPSPIPPP